jgi:hypothetical protein
VTRGTRARLAGGLVLAALAAPATASAQVVPPSTGADGPCDFTSAGTYTLQTDTGKLTRPDATTAILGVDPGENTRVLNCTSLNVGAASRLQFTGQRAPDIRASSAIFIEGVVTASATFIAPGAGAARAADGYSDGTSGIGSTPGTPLPGEGGVATFGGEGAEFGGGGGGGGIAGGGGGAGGTATVAAGGNGGGTLGGAGGTVKGQGGTAGAGGGAADGEDAGGGDGGGGGGGSYGNQGPFHPGSGGGGGGGRSTTGSGGGDGGHGGGALRISSPVGITVTPTATIEADGSGGNLAGFSSGTGGGSGGGGSGGGLHLLAPAMNLAAGAQISAIGGDGGVGAFGDFHPAGGDGGPGRIDLAVNQLTDGGALVSPAPITTIYSDPVPLDTEITKAKVKRNGKAKAKFTGSGGTAPLSFECKLDRKKYKPCTSPRKLKRLKPGKHKFRVRSVDATGAVDATPAKTKLKRKRRR